MTNITREALLEFAKYYVEYWNSGDKDPWIKNWKKIAPGDFLMLDPVGTPPKIGFENVAIKGYDLFQPCTHLHIDPELLFVCGNEISWVMENTFTKDGNTSMLRSIEIYRFDDDGSVEIRTYYDVPDANDPVSGEVFSVHLPGDK